MKINFLKRLFILLIATTFIALQANAQTTDYGTFIIESTGSVTNVKPYVHAIQKANMEAYRYKTKLDTISFDNGVKVVLLSAQELFIKGIHIEVADYTDEQSVGYTKPVFHLTSDGKLVALYKSIGKEK